MDIIKYTVIIIIMYFSTLYLNYFSVNLIATLSWNSSTFMIADHKILLQAGGHCYFAGVFLRLISCDNLSRVLPTSPLLIHKHTISSGLSSFSLTLLLQGPSLWAQLLSALIPFLRQGQFPIIIYTQHNFTYSKQPGSQLGAPNNLTLVLAAYSCYIWPRVKGTFYLPRKKELVM